VRSYFVKLLLAQMAASSQNVKGRCGLEKPGEYSLTESNISKRMCSPGLPGSDSPRCTAGNRSLASDGISERSPLLSPVSLSTPSVSAA
jgi:hypothetical protein